MQFTPDNLPAIPDGYPTLYPSHLLNPNKKDKNWHLNYCKTMYFMCKNNLGYFSNDRKVDWVDARLYADGNQSVQKYFEWCSSLKDSTGATVSYMNLNWKIVSPIPKFYAVLKGYFSKLNYKVQATSINPEAALAKERMKASIFATQKLKPFFSQLEQAAGQKLGENPVHVEMPDDVETKEEIEMWFSRSYRDQSEQAMEKLQRMALYENDWKSMSSELWDDVIKCGCIGAVVKIDRIGKKVKVRYCDPVNMVLDNFRGHDGNDMERIGEFCLMTIAQLKLAAGDQFTEEEYYDIAFKHQGQYGNESNLVPYADYVNSDSIYTYNQWDNYQILVMEWYTDSCDRIKHERKMVKGVSMLFKKPFDTPIGKKAVNDADGKFMYEKEVFATDTKTVYGGCWIVGSDYIYDWGKVSDISRPNENKKECMKPMKFYRITNQSVIELAIPFADSYMLSWLKIQNLKARAIPKGIIIEVGALENVMLDGKVKSAQELIELAVQTGIIIYRKHSTLDDGNIDTSIPIQETKGGMGAEFNELLQSMASDLMSIREVMGISQMFDASQQNPRTPVANAELAVKGTENALTPMVEGFEWMHEKIAIDVCLKFQLLARYMTIEGYAPALGTGVLETVKIGKEITGVTLGITLEALPTEEQKQRIIAAAQEALKSTNDPTKGGLTWPQYLKMLRYLDAGDLKGAESYFNYQVTKYKAELAKQQADNIKQQGEQNKQLQQEKIQAEQQLEKIQTDNAIAINRAKSDDDIRVLQAEYGFKKELLGMDHGHDLAVARGEAANARK